MGTYEYVMDQSSLLRVSLKPPPEALKPTMDKKESFSISKIWMRGGLRRKDSSAAPSGSSSRRASSFRLPTSLQRAASDIGAPKRRADVVSPVTESEYNVSAWDKSRSGSIVDWDVESAQPPVG
ncbi:hypothetical protein ZWY2020_034280 [Hordeum vulgare]|nr:hypothetical protein ZWY2020_034280 [Hordeum vulgare]